MTNDEWQPTQEMEDSEAPAPNPEKLITAPPSPTAKRSTRRPGASTRRPPSGSRKRSKAPSTTPKQMTPEEGLRGVMQLGATGLILSGQRAKSIPLIADGATILVHGPGLAAAIAEIAENDPRVMALLEKVITFGPYGGLATALFLMTAQFARNHGAPEELTELAGAMPPEKIIEAAGIDVTVIQVPAPSENGGRSNGDDTNI